MSEVPGPSFVARRSHARTVLLLMVCLAFVVLGLWLAGVIGEIDSPREGVRQRLPRWIYPCIGWSSVAFFGAAAVSWMVQLFGPLDVLRIDAEGILWRRWSNRMIPWGEIRRVSKESIGAQSVVVLALRDPTLFPGRTFHGFIGRTNRWFFQGDIAISLTDTDASVGQALAAIRQYHRST